MSARKCAECGCIAVEHSEAETLERTIRELRAMLPLVSDQGDYDTICAAIRLLGGNP